MDFDSDSSDFHFPSDTGLAKLSSPLAFKATETRDWAYEDFMHSLQTKSTEADTLLGFKQYIPVNEEEEDEDEDEEEEVLQEERHFKGLGFELDKLEIPTLGEKGFLTMIANHFRDLEREEVYDILKGGFSLVQNDIQSNANASPFSSANPGLSWYDEAIDFGHQQQYTIENLDSVEIRKENDFSPFKEINHVDSNLLPPVEVETVAQQDQEQLLATNVVTPLPQFDKPLPPLPTKKLNFKNKLKSKLVKTFQKKQIITATQEKSNKKSFISSAKKIVSKMVTA